MIDTLLTIITKIKTDMNSKSINNQLHTKLLITTNTKLLETESLDKNDIASNVHKMKNSIYLRQRPLRLTPTF